jgi:pimeloyl-ACP methyl ester carboxylesterase
MKDKLKKIVKYFAICISVLILLVFTLPYLVPVSEAQKPKEINYFENSKYMTVSDQKLHYRTWINSDSVNSHKWILLLHGMGGSTYSWENNAKIFCDSGYNVVAVDIPPFGYSEKNPDYNYSTDNISALMWQFAKRINDKYPWILIGHSMGGGIAQCMAIEKPKKITKVVFVAPALFTELKPGRSFGQFITSISPVERLMCVLGETFYLKPARIRKILESSFASDVPDEVVNQYYKALNNDGFTTAFLRSFSKSNSCKQVNGLNFNIESLAFFGTADTWVPYSQTKIITDQLQCIKIISIENAGHSLMETNSVEFNKQVMQFLNSPVVNN